MYIKIRIPKNISERTFLIKWLDIKSKLTYKYPNIIDDLLLIYHNDSYYIESPCEISIKCEDMWFISDKNYYDVLKYEVYNHDLSKMSENEFIQYRKMFYPCSDEPKYTDKSAWEHHKKNNKHHWETWTKLKETYPNELKIHCVHMVILVSNEL